MSVLPDMPFDPEPYIPFGRGPQKAEEMTTDAFPTGAGRSAGGPGQTTLDQHRHCASCGALFTPNPRARGRAVAPFFARSTCPGEPIGHERVCVRRGPRCAEPWPCSMGAALAGSCALPASCCPLSAPLEIQTGIAELPLAGAADLVEKCLERLAAIDADFCRRGDRLCRRKRVVCFRPRCHTAALLMAFALGDDGPAIVDLGAPRQKIRGFATEC